MSEFVKFLLGIQIYVLNCVLLEYEHLPIPVSLERANEA